VGKSFAARRNCGELSPVPGNRNFSVKGKSLGLFLGGELGNKANEQSILPKKLSNKTVIIRKNMLAKVKRLHSRGFTRKKWQSPWRGGGKGRNTFMCDFANNVNVLSMCFL